MSFLITLILTVLIKFGNSHDSYKKWKYWVKLNLRHSHKIKIFVFLNKKNRSNKFWFWFQDNVPINYK